MQSDVVLSKGILITLSIVLNREIQDLEAGGSEMP